MVTWLLVKSPTLHVVRCASPCPDGNRGAALRSGYRAVPGPSRSRPKGLPRAMVKPIALGIAAIWLRYRCRCRYRDIDVDVDIDVDIDIILYMYIHVNILYAFTGALFSVHQSPRLPEKEARRWWGYEMLLHKYINMCDIYYIYIYVYSMYIYMCVCDICARATSIIIHIVYICVCVCVCLYGLNQLYA